MQSSSKIYPRRSALDTRRPKHEDEIQIGLLSVLQSGTSHIIRICRDSSMSTQKSWSLLGLFGSMTSNRVAVFVVQCKIVLVKKHLAFVSPWVFDRWSLKLRVVVRTEGDLRLDGLCKGDGHSGSWLLRIEEACSGGLNFMSISGLLFAAFVPVFATFVSDTRYRYPLPPTLRSRKVTLACCP